MTFSHQFYREFCFSDFDNSCQGRKDAKTAMKNIAYRGGNTHTGEAFRCAHREMLTSSCGFESNYDCLDIVFVTDGRSNGNLRVCDVVADFRRRFSVTTFSIGIGSSINQSELECIATNSQAGSNVFQFPDITSFINNLCLLNTLFQTDNSQFTCTRTDTHAIPLENGNCTPEAREDCP